MVPIPFFCFESVRLLYTMSSRKRSRWGSNSDDNNAANASRGSRGNQQADDAVVSDQEAVRALLTSAVAATASSQPPQQQQQKGRGGGRGSGGGPRQGERRSGDDGRGGGVGGVDGHYGPAQRGEQSRGNDYKHANNDGGAFSRGDGDSKRSRWSSSSDTASASTARGDGNPEAAAAGKGAAEAPAVVKEKPNFGLSGALAKKDDVAGARGGGGGGSNMYKGVLLKFREPPEARAPAHTYWRLYVFKGKEELETLHIAKQSAYLIGRNADICDIVIQHPSARYEKRTRRIHGVILLTLRTVVCSTNSLISPSVALSILGAALSMP
jgi:hypothetical protein